MGRAHDRHARRRAPGRGRDAIERAAARARRASGPSAIGEVTNTLAAVARARAARHRRHRLPRGLRPRIASARCAHRLAELEGRRSRRTSGLGRARISRTRPRPTPSTRRTPTRCAPCSPCARERGVRTTVHLAEHPAERTFLVEGSGPFVDFATRAELPDRRLSRCRTRVRSTSRPISVCSRPTCCSSTSPTCARASSTRRRVGRAGRALPALEPLHRGEAPAARRDADAGHRTRARHRLARLEPVARRAGRGEGARRSLSRRFPRASLTTWRPRPARARSAATISAGSPKGAPRGPRHRRRARPTRTRAPSSCANRARAPKVDRAPRGRSRRRGRGVMIAESIGRVRTFSSLVKLSHTVFALPFAASAVVLSTPRPHVPLTLRAASPCSSRW